MATQTSTATAGIARRMRQIRAGLPTLPVLHPALDRRTLPEAPPMTEQQITNLHVRFDLTTNGLNWWPANRIVSPINNQWFTHQWFKPTPESSIGVYKIDGSAYSNLICSGEFDCNTGLNGDKDYGRIKGYVTKLPPGKYVARSASARADGTPRALPFPSPALGRACSPGRERFAGRAPPRNPASAGPASDKARWR